MLEESKARCVSYGQAGKAKGGGARIKPGTGKGNAYCARSYGDMKSHGKDCSGKDRGTAIVISHVKNGSVQVNIHVKASKIAKTATFR